MKFSRISLLICLLLLMQRTADAQSASVKARVDAQQIAVGDQIKLFIEAAHTPKQERLQWANIPDTFHSLEVIERGKIDTVSQGDLVTYTQRLLITGFDSGSFKIPAFAFSVIPSSGSAYTLSTDSFEVLVQTLPVDTTKPFKGIKDIIPVERSWQEYLWLIVGAVIAIVLIAVAIHYFRKNKKVPIPPPTPKKPAESVDAKALRLLEELERQQLWQANRVKEYYSQLSEILRSYIEERFQTPALELTTDELLHKAQSHKEMSLQYDKLSIILTTADLAKFAKAQPLPYEHTNAMELTKRCIIQTRPAPVTNTQSQS